MNLSKELLLKEMQMEFQKTGMLFDFFNHLWKKINRTAGFYGTLLVVFASLFSFPVKADVFSRIEVQNNKRIDAEVIKNMANLHPGKSISKDQLNEAVKRLFRVGLFSDVRIHGSGRVLFIRVVEKEIVHRVLFKGNKKLKEKQILEIISLKPRASFSQDVLDSDLAILREAYKKVGISFVHITPQVVNLGEGRVDVVLHIKEGKRSRIRKISFTGNRAFSSQRLSKVILTKHSHFLSFLFRNDIFDKDRLQADEQALQVFYTEHGYADFQILSSSAVQNAEGDYVINFHLEEGPKYVFGDVVIESTIPDISRSILNKKLMTHKGEVYNATKISLSILALNEAAASQGYAFAEVDSRLERDPRTRRISVFYTLDKGRRTYVERIEIEGNTHTRDYVIRREFDMSEGDIFSPLFIRRARTRLEQLDFFERIDISTKEGSSSDQVVLVVSVKEKSTGELSGGAGYGVGAGIKKGVSSSNASLQASLSERNFKGTGQKIKFAASGGSSNQEYVASFTEPYFLGQRISAGIEGSYQTSSQTYYNTEELAGSLRMGLPLFDSVNAFVSYDLSSQKYSYSESCVTKSCFLSSAIIEAIDFGNWISSSVKGQLVYSTMNSLRLEGYGNTFDLSSEFAGLGGNAKYLKLIALGSHYRILHEGAKIIGVLSGGAGKIIPIDSSGLRVFDQFRSSSRIIRGFEYNGIGPYDPTDFSKSHLGGSIYMNASASIEFPLPFIPEALGIKSAIFTDAATLYGSEIASVLVAGNDSSWRLSSGVSLIWSSPFGPLRLDYAFPWKKEVGDQVQEISFGVSTQF